MIDPKKPIRVYEIGNATIEYLYNERDGSFRPPCKDIIPEEIDEIGLVVTCDLCGDESRMVIEPIHVEEEGAYYPLMRIRRVSEK